jgi:hypothetical protein
MTKHFHYKSFPVAGFSFYDGATVFKKLKIGSKLKLKAENKNLYDLDTIAIYSGSYRLGFVPQNTTYALYQMWNNGYEIFETRILFTDRTAAPDNQLGVVVFLKRRNTDTVMKTRTPKTKEKEGVWGKSAALDSPNLTGFEHVSPAITPKNLSHAKV